MPDTSPRPANDLQLAAQKLAAARNKKRLALASGRETEPEVLYYLVEDEAPEIRAAVAANPEFGCFPC